MFRTRLISGILLVIAALATIGCGGIVLATTLAAVSIIGFMELLKATGVHTQNKTINGMETVGILGILAFYIILFLGLDTNIQMLVIILTFLAYLFVYVFLYPKYTTKDVMPAFFSFLYAPILLSYIYQTRQLQHGAYLVWMIFISSWGSDTCAYCVGMLCGKHKMAPKLSPKKSVEGGIGGVLGATILGAVYGALVVAKQTNDERMVWVMAIIGAAGALISMVGDLAASAIKRNHEIKDYGKLIPGHGGIMDRFDSVIVTAPVIYYLATLLI